MLAVIPRFAALACVAAAATLHAQNLELAHDGKALCAIVVGANAIEAEKTAARELAVYLNKITGASFTLQETAAANEPAIYVGQSEAVRQLAPGILWDQLKPDTIVIQSVGNKLILAGDRPRGALYAVYTFLEDTLGVRWWTPADETVPSRPALAVPPQKTVYAPPLSTREVFTDGTQKNAIFATRMKNNGHYQTQKNDLGGHIAVLGFTHTFFTVIPPGKYFKTHPEWFSDHARGGNPCTSASEIPNDGNSQLCLTNESLRAEFIKNSLEWLRRSPGTQIISLSQMDNPVKCQCPVCMAAEREEGAAAGPLIRFTNAVAEEIEKDFPKVQIETLAYWHTVEPPRRVKPRHNVVIRLCTQSVDTAQPLDADRNAEFRQSLLQWAAISPQLSIWDYTVGFRHLVYPFPNIKTFAPNIRFFVAHKTISLFEQADAYTNGCGDFVQLRAWLLSHLMWNPNFDQDQLTREFLQGYYGAAAPYLRQYLDLIDEAFARSGEKLKWWPTECEFLSLDVMNQATDLFARAQQSVADDDVLAKRVRQARMPLDNAWILNYGDLRAEAKHDGKSFHGPEDIAAYVDDFAAAGREYNVKWIAEGRPFEPYAKAMQARYTQASGLPDAVKSLIPPKLNTDNVIYATAEHMQLFTGPRDNPWVEIVKDPLAGQSVVRMPGTHTAWAMQYPYGLMAAGKGIGQRYHIYMLARVEADPSLSQKAPVMACGILGNTPGTPGARVVPPVMMTPTLSQVGGDAYKVIDLGVHSCFTGTLIWAAPVRNPAIRSIFIQGIVMAPL